MTDRPVVVIDNGTGYTKMGYAGNLTPNYLVPSMIQTRLEEKKASGTVIPDLDFYIGEEALSKKAGYDSQYMIRHGLIADWDHMERYWHRCIYQYMRCDPEEHYVMLTEPPMNSPENREYTAEIMFETFNVPGLHIAVQAVLSLYAAKSTASQRAKAAEKKYSNNLTGTVIDAGDGVTHIIPVVEGFVIGSCIKHIPLAGRTVTDFVLQQMRNRQEKFPRDEAIHIARRVKESYCYVSKDLAAEFAKYDSDPAKQFQKFVGIDSKTRKEYSVDVGYERFLGPEIFFNPEIFSDQFTDPLSKVVDQTIQACPIDARRDLYSFLTLSGGSTMFKNFHKRLERDVNRRLEQRHSKMMEKFSGKVTGSKALKAKVIKHEFQRFAVWLGGSIMASQPGAHSMFKTKAEYEEHGPRIARFNPVSAEV